MVLSWGYAFSGAIIAHLGIFNSEPINIAFRAVYLGSALYLILGATLHRRSFKFTKFAWIFIMFLIIYLIRMFYDIEYRQLRYGRLSPSYIYIYSIGNNFIPAVAVFLTAKYCSYKDYIKILYWFLLIVNVMLITYVIRAFGFNFDVFMARNALDVDATDKNRAVLGPITYSFTGEVLAVISLFMLLVKDVLKKPPKKALLLFTFALGVLNLLLGASRSPFLGFVFISMLCFFYYLRNSKKTWSFYNKLLGAFIIMTATVLTLLKTVFKNVDFYIFTRLQTMVDKQQSGTGEHRNAQWGDTIEKFLSEPIFGEAFVLRRNDSQFVGVDPHNVFLEVFMSVGIFGAIFFYLAYFGFLTRLYIAFMNNYKTYFIFGILMIASTFAMLTSSSIFLGYKWLPLMCFLLSIPVLDKKVNRSIKH